MYPERRQTKHEADVPFPTTTAVELGQPHAFLFAFQTRLAETHLQLKELSFVVVKAETLLQEKQL